MSVNFVSFLYWIYLEFLTDYFAQMSNGLFVLRDVYVGAAKTWVNALAKELAKVHAWEAKSSSELRVA